MEKQHLPYTSPYEYLATLACQLDSAIELGKRGLSSVNARDVTPLSRLVTQVLDLLDWALEIPSPPDHMNESLAAAVGIEAIASALADARDAKSPGAGPPLREAIFAAMEASSLIEDATKRYLSATSSHEIFSPAMALSPPANHPPPSAHSNHTARVARLDPATMSPRSLSSQRRPPPTYWIAAATFILGVLVLPALTSNMQDESATAKALSLAFFIVEPVAFIYLLIATPLLFPNRLTHRLAGLAWLLVGACIWTIITTLLR